jgi:hypothetical protein
MGSNKISGSSSTLMQYWFMRVSCSDSKDMNSSYFSDSCPFHNVYKVNFLNSCIEHTILFEYSYYPVI